MLRMEIALFLVLGVVAYMYDSAERTRTALHRTFSALLAAGISATPVTLAAKSMLRGGRPVVIGVSTIWIASRSG